MNGVAHRSPLRWLASLSDDLAANLPVPAPPLLVELSSRLAAQLVSVASPAHADGAEARIRGILMACGHGPRSLRVGRNVRLIGGAKITMRTGVTLSDNVFLSATGPHGRIEIGTDTHVDVGSVLYGQGGLRIGNGCAIAAGVAIYSQSNQYRSAARTPILSQGTVYAAVEIGNDVWIGAHAVVLPGVSVGDHAVIGAGAVVTRDVEPWSVVAGVPARTIGRRDAR